MTTTHAEFLELAAAAIDFELSAAERESLAAHLAGCVACRRRLAGLQADQRAIAQLPRYSLAPAVAQQVRGDVRRRVRPARSPIRLLAVAAVLALLALTAFTVGSQLLRRSRDSDLSVVTPTVAVVASPTASAPTASAPPDPSVTAPGPGVFAKGSILEVVVTGLRVRTAPTVDNAKSAKLEPLLGPGVKLEVLGGPVTADDYDWYEVQAVGLPHRGWVAAADHDGVAWIDDPASTATPLSAATADEAALIAALRTDAAVRCAPRRTDLPVLATAGVDCRVGSSLVERVGAYRFRDARDAATTYLDRLAAYDVAPTTGDCLAGTGGDAAWMPGDGTPGADRVSVAGTGPWVVGRSGCFLDENGTANVRVTCGSMYVGVLGRGTDPAALYRWVWDSPGSVETGDPPGICRTGA